MPLSFLPVALKKERYKSEEVMHTLFSEESTECSVLTTALHGLDPV